MQDEIAHGGIEGAEAERGGGRAGRIGAHGQPGTGGQRVIDAERQRAGRDPGRPRVAVQTAQGDRAGAGLGKARRARELGADRAVLEVEVAAFEREPAFI